MDHLEAMRCHCGCGQFKDDAHDEGKQDRWQPHAATCYAAKALAAFRKDRANELGPGSLTYVSLAPEGAEITDPLESAGYDPDRARKNYEEHQRKWGLAD